MVNKSNPDNNKLRLWSHLNLKKHAQNYERRVLFSIISVFVLSTVFVLTNVYPTDNAHAQLYPFIASSRGSFDISNGNDTQQVELPSVLSILNRNDCPGELAIYVHGIWANDSQAEEQTDRVSLSLRDSGYSIPLIGFSWDSNTAFSLDNLTLSYDGWMIAKNIANENGPILGKFISDYKTECPQDNIRIIAHSLGSRVTLSALQWIHDNIKEQNDNNATKEITSVHLMGATVNNDQISTNPNDCISYTPYLPCSGEVIQSEVGYFSNLFNPEDNMLAGEINPFCWICGLVKSPYELSEGHNALGAYGAASTIGVPSNFDETDVSNLIIVDTDSNKDGECDIQYPVTHICTISKNGDNHFGYMGYRDDIDRQTVYDSGAIKQIVNDWQSENN
ncbi:MAG: alpha/beta hydrolase [Candidatus Nitrosocosmicus sp.]|nr:alpha/beta hydrolase [Candidatus Nitrosocosmicus sp.]